MSFFKSLIHPELDASEWLNNVLFGLIMVLTTTALLNVYAVSAPITGVQELDEELDDDGDTPRSILKQVVGCNIAWGIINGGLLILDRLYVRGRTDRLLRSIRKARSDEEALAIVEDENEWDLDDVTTPEARERLYRDVLNRARSVPPTMRLGAQDVADAIVTAIVVAATALPIVLSVLLVPNPQYGFVIGNSISLLIIFLVGFFWARKTNVNPWRTGIAMVLFGAVAVGVAWSLGG